MRLLCSMIFLVTVSTVSVNSYCLTVKCKTGFIRVRDRCRVRLGRSAADADVGGCYGRDKIFINDEILDHPGPLSIACPEEYVFNGKMECRRDGWESGSGPWETHHFRVRGRNVVLEMKKSDHSIRYRSFSLDGGRK